jgi:4-hydroxy-4-methyl-2-oxoglutarate aldolase
MKRNHYFLILMLAMIPVALHAQTAVQSQNPTEEDILKLYKGLRVADVSDGMDMVGLPDVGLMTQSIEPLWRNIDDFSHMFTGFAVTVRYVPTQRHVPNNMSTEEFQKWEGNWYNQLSPEPFVEHLRPGSVVVIDNQGDGDTGTTGSNNAMLWVKRGAVGIVSAGGVRDTDEVIKQKIPVYMELSRRGRGIRPGRNEVESVQKPVVIGGVLINPGDLIVADGDGVIVVPREKAVPVAVAAREILVKDKEARKALYKELGLPLDFTVE